MPNGSNDHNTTSRFAPSCNYWRQAASDSKHPDIFPVRETWVPLILIVSLYANKPLNHLGRAVGTVLRVNAEVRFIANYSWNILLRGSYADNQYGTQGFFWT